ncbi:MAG: hypothetical protein KAS17_00195 [Victivallaceae bacterium]|nr:hypothetical protein [Victivallaceae bacterium]
MNSLTERNMSFIRSIYNGSSQRHGLMNMPERILIFDENGDYTLSSKPVNDWLPLVTENYKRECDLLEALQDDTIPMARLSTCTHIFAKAFGCDVRCSKDSPACALPMVANAAEADKLNIPDIWKTECLYRIFELGRTVLEELGSDTPLGACDLQTGFDVANLIWDKTDLLCAMIENPEAVKRLAGKCAKLVKDFLIELRKEFPTLTSGSCPGDWAPLELGVSLSNDEVGIMSPNMFEEFCLPELVDLSETFGGLGMHCCADAEHQFPGFNKIPDFYRFNRVAAKRGYMPLLDHFTGAESPVHVLAWVSEEDIKKLIINAPQGTRFIFVNLGATKESGAQWLENIRKIMARQARQVGPS